jgi:adenine-specific DNA-methyltransferase
MQLNYDGKKNKSEILSKSAACSAFIIPKADNLVIAGDNFYAMSVLLNNGYKGKIDLIYTDPPFFTNSDFIIENDRARTVSSAKNGEIAYSDKFAKEEYLEFMRERFILMRELLSDSGSFYLHIDTKIGHYLKIILDEIFGEDNFLNEITRKKGNPKNFNRRAYGNEKDVIYFYAKKRGMNIWNDVRIMLQGDEINLLFKKNDGEGRAYTTVPVHAPGECDGETGSEWRGMKPPRGRHWRTSPKELDLLDQQGLIEWSKTGNPRIIKYADEHQGKKIQDIWTDFKDTPYPGYPTQKNRAMLDLIIKQSSDENSVVLDCFAGSGTTLKSAEELCRRFIAVDNGEISVQLLKDSLHENSLLSGTEFIDLRERFEYEYMAAKKHPNC